MGLDPAWHMTQTHVELIQTTSLLHLIQMKPKKRWLVNPLVWRRETYDIDDPHVSAGWALTWLSLDRSCCFSGVVSLLCAAGLNKADISARSQFNPGSPPVAVTCVKPWPVVCLFVSIPGRHFHGQQIYCLDYWSRVTRHSCLNLRWRSSYQSFLIHFITVFLFNDQLILHHRSQLKQIDK